MDEMMKFSQETNIFYHWKKKCSSSKVALKTGYVCSQVCTWKIFMGPLWPCTGTGPKEKYLASSSKARIPGRPAKALVDLRILGFAQKFESHG